MGQGSLNCCGAKLMNNRGTVIIDKGYTIPEGRYTSLKVILLK